MLSATVGSPVGQRERQPGRPAGGVFTLRQFAEQDGQSAPEPVPVDADMATRGDS